MLDVLEKRLRLAIPVSGCIAQITGASYVISGNGALETPHPQTARAGRAESGVPAVTHFPAAHAGRSENADQFHGTACYQRTKSPSEKIHMKVIATFVIAIAILLAQPAQGVTIDDFTTLQFLSQTGTGASSNVASGAGILGTERDMSLTVTSGPGLAQLGAVIGEFLHNTPTGTAATSVTTWDGVDGSASVNTIGLGGVDLTDGGLSNVLRVRVAASDLATSIKFDVFGALGSASATTAVPASLSAANFLLPFSSFGVTSGSGVNFASVGAIQMTIVGSTALDLTLVFVDTVPEPSGLFVLSCAAGLMLRRKRTRTFRAAATCS